MSTEQSKRQSTPFNFISHDGTDENGVRAEVNVQVNKGTVKEIKENTAKEVADVHFAVTGLKFPIHGWIRTDEPVYQLAKTAQESGEEVTFRIETQRKPSIDRKKPMEELRPDSNTARENVKVILVGINNVLSGEAVTNPAEDPKHAGGRYPATEQDRSTTGPAAASTGTSVSTEELINNFKVASATPGVRGSVLDAMAAQLLLQGVDVETVNTSLAGPDKRDNARPEARQNFSMEAPSWKEYNSDGRLNLGSSVIAAGVGVETLITDRVHTLAEQAGYNELIIRNIDDAIEYYMDTVFAIADRVQVASYGEGSRVDRAAASHVRIRGIVYELIKKEFPLPLTFTKISEEHVDAVYNQEKHKNWVSSIGKEGIKRFRRAVVASTSYKGFALPVPESLFVEGTQPVKVEEPVPTSKPEPTVNPEVQEEKIEVTVEQPIQDEPSLSEEEEEVLTASETPAVAASTEKIYDTSVIYPQNILSAEIVEGEDLPTEETINTFKQLFADSGFDVSDKGDLVRITKLLAYTFGADYSNVKKIPEALVEDFVDFYTVGGPEALDHAVRVAVEQV
jgi:hypothetical protein